MPPPRPPSSYPPVLPWRPGLPVGMGVAGLNAADRSGQYQEASVYFAGISHPAARRKGVRGEAQSSPDLRVSLRNLPQHSQPSPDTKQPPQGGKTTCTRGSQTLASAQAAPPRCLPRPRDALHWVQNRSNSTAGAGASFKSKKAVGTERTFLSLAMAQREV